MTNDLLNAAMEGAGAVLLLRNCRLLYLAKRVQGVSVLATAYFTVWGVWNLYFYPANGLWASFFGGVFLATANLAWVILALRYSWRMPQRTKHTFLLPLSSNGQDFKRKLLTRVTALSIANRITM